MDRPIYLSGKVVLAEGTPPPEPVVVERVCNGRPRPEGYTDSKGRFSFQLGQNQGMFADASVGSAGEMSSIDPSRGGRGGAMGPGGTRAITERDLVGCELRASLPGYLSSLVNLSGRRVMDNPDVGTIVLTRIAGVEGTVFSALAAQAPKDARKAFEKGNDLLKKKKTEEAQKEFLKAVSIYPKYTTAWYELGRVYELDNKPEDARKAYGEALAADAKYVNPYRRLATIAFKEQKWPEVAEVTDKVLKLDPISYADAYFYNAVANYYMKNYDQAEKSARESRKIDSRNQIPMTSNLLGHILIEKQDYAGAAAQLRDYLKLVPADAPDAARTKSQLEQLEKAITAKNAQQ
jgi:tetratricopeptide (TPR) repeat protein